MRNISRKESQKYIFPQSKQCFEENCSIENGEELKLLL